MQNSSKWLVELEKGFRQMFVTSGALHMAFWRKFRVVIGALRCQDASEIFCSIDPYCLYLDPMEFEFLIRIPTSSMQLDLISKEAMEILIQPATLS